MSLREPLGPGYYAYQNIGAAKTRISEDAAKYSSAARSCIERAIGPINEPIARQVLADELQSVPSVEIAGASATGTEASAKISTLDPDLVFLDLQMPVMGGAVVIKDLPSSIPRPLVVVVTAFDEQDQYGQTPASSTTSTSR